MEVWTSSSPLTVNTTLLDKSGEKKLDGGRGMREGGKAKGSGRSFEMSFPPN